MPKRLMQQARGKGGPGYRTPDFRSIGIPRHPELGLNMQAGEIIDIVKCPLHTAPIAKVKYPNAKEENIMIAPEGIRTGDIITNGEIAPGSSVALKNIPEGTLIYNIEGTPGDGGKFVRVAGTTAKLDARQKDTVTVILPSKKIKSFSPDCRANIGVIAGSGKSEKPMLKAGNMHHKMRAINRRWPIVKGAAQNAVDHPFGNKRTSRKSKARPAPKNAPPGRKVGMIRPRRTGRKTR